MREARSYASWWLFSALCILAFGSFLSNAGKLQGLVGKLVRGCESASAGIAYFALGWLALQRDTIVGVSRAADVTIAGFVPSSPAGIGLALALALSLGAMMIVRTAIDFFIWLNPIPFVDAVFETVKHGFSLAFLFLYFLSPTAAAFVAITILAVSICLVPWAVRLLDFGYSILLDPLLRRLTRAPVAVLPEQNAGEAVLIAMALNARGFKKRPRITCVREPGRLRLEARSVFGRKTARPLASEYETVRIGRALSWLEIQVVNSDGRTCDRFALSRVDFAHLPGLCAILGADDVGDIGTRRFLRELQKGANVAAAAAAESVRGYRFPGDNN